MKYSNYKITKLILLFLFLNSFKIYPQEFKSMVISVPVSDVKDRPINNNNNKFDYPILSKADPLISTQLLFNEQILASTCEDDKGWLKIIATEQKSYSKEKQWHNIIGFIKKDQAIEVKEFDKTNYAVKTAWSNIYEQPDLGSSVRYKVSFGTKFLGKKIEELNEWIKVKYFDNQWGYIQSKNLNNIPIHKNLDIEKTRELIKNLSNEFFDGFYRWGGRSSFGINGSGVDCSGFTNLVYRVAGFDIPRGSKAQYFLSDKIDGIDLQPGDLIFFSKEKNPEKIYHVLLYLGDGKIAECTGRDKSDKKFTIQNDKDFLGTKIENLKSGKLFNGKIIKNEYIFFGTYLKNEQTIFLITPKIWQENTTKII